MTEFCIHGGSHAGETIDVRDDFSGSFIHMRVKWRPIRVRPLCSSLTGPQNLSTERYQIDRASGALIFVD